MWASVSSFFGCFSFRPLAALFYFTNMSQIKVQLLLLFKFTVRYKKVFFRLVVWEHLVSLFQYESSVAVRDRVAFACMFLSDAQVTADWSCGQTVLSRATKRASCTSPAAVNWVCFGCSAAAASVHRQADQRHEGGGQPGGHAADGAD